MLKNVEVKILDERLKQMMIGRATDGSAAIDLHACVDEDVIIKSGGTLKINSGLSVFIRDPNYCAMILPRSGMGNKGLVIANTVGLIDADYQGAIEVSVLNRRTSRDYQPASDFIYIKPMDRIAQLVFLPIARPEFTFVEEFSETTHRGVGGFGSTGK